MVGGGLKIKFTIQASFLRIKINCCAQKVNVGLLGQVVDFSSVRNIDTLVKINIQLSLVLVTHDNRILRHSSDLGISLLTYFKCLSLNKVMPNLFYLGKNCLGCFRKQDLTRKCVEIASGVFVTTVVPKCIPIRYILIALLKL